MEERKFEQMLTKEEIVEEIDKIRYFFEQISPEIKASTVEYLILEIINWGSYNHYEALGILQEILFRYREESLRSMYEENEEESKEVND